MKIYNLYKNNIIMVILSTIIMAGFLGVYVPSLFMHIGFLGDVFINLLKLFALPLITSSLIVAIASMGSNIQNLRSLASKVLLYMILSEILAVSIALILFNIFKPGLNIPVSLISKNAAIDTANTGMADFSLAKFITSSIPHNIFESLAKFDLLPVVIFAIMFGIACIYTKHKNITIVIDFFTAIKEISATSLHGLMLVAPVGIFALVGRGIAEVSLSGKLANSLFALLIFILILFVGLFLQGLWQFIGVLIFSKQNGRFVLKKSIPVLSMAFATSSSVATLPLAMDTANSLKAKPYITQFMLPICASINIGGMMMYEVAATLFFCQILGLDISIMQQILIAVICILCGIAEGGIPETSLVSLVVVFKIVNIPLQAISILLPLDRIIDRFRTMVNIFGNMCGVIIVSSIVKSNNSLE